ncbi:MAG: MerR family transcriptional regulator [Chitinophagales bacterium]|nr:MerR family transcriptional regulator [Chitinophagales bacterium]
MPYKEKDIEKLYYSISEVAKMLDVNTSLIRFWEKEFPSLKPRKTAKGNRLFTQKDIENLKLIYYLVKEKGFTLEGAKNKLKEGNVVVATDKQATLVTKLKEIRNFLQTLHDEI